MTDDIILEAIPDELRTLRQWVLWKLVERDGKPDKFPFQTTGEMAKIDDATTWTTFDSVVERFAISDSYTGIGFVFSKNDSYCGIDLDGCRDPKTGAVEQWAQMWINRFATYTEVSPSNTGFKLWTRGTNPKGTGGSIKVDHDGVKLPAQKDETLSETLRERYGKTPGVEIYDQKRFFTVTGRHVSSTPTTIEPRQGVLEEFVVTYWPERKVNGSEYRPTTPDWQRIVDRASKYLAKLPPAIQGNNGSDAAFHAACELFRFGLNDSEAAAVFDEYNQRCVPPWNEREVKHKLTDARERVTAAGEFGCRLRQNRPRPDEEGATATKAAELKEPNEAGSESETESEQLPDDSSTTDVSDLSGGITRKLADHICRTDHFAQDAGGKLYLWRRGNYVPRGEQHVRARVKSIMIDWKLTTQWTPKQANDVVEYIRVDAPELWERPPIDVLNVKNGLLRIQDRVLLPHSPEHFSSVQLPLVYNPTATCPATERFVDDVFPNDATCLAWEITAYLMVPFTFIQKAVLLNGPGGNGKSTWLAQLIAFLGKSNTSALSLHKLESDKFAASRLFGKLANICPDLPSDHLAGTSVFKAITGGDPVTGEYKFRDSFDFVPFARLVFSCNVPPRSADSSSAFFDRWQVIPFNRSFRGTAEEITRDVMDARLSDPAELSGLLNKALDALPSIQQRHAFSEPESVKAAWLEFHSTTDPLAVWLDRHTVDAPEALVVKKDLRTAFNAALERQARPHMTETSFGTSFAKLRPTVESKQRTINGKLQWCYIGIGISQPIYERRDELSGFTEFTE